MLIAKNMLVEIEGKSGRDRGREQIEIQNDICSVSNM